ncbi:hypothetical protein PMAYCL1PPCAC_15891, partial [Pristionchus mayeri]
ISERSRRDSHSACEDDANAQSRVHLLVRDSHHRLAPPPAPSHLLYFAPACILQAFPFAESWTEIGGLVADTIFVFCWYHSVLSHIIIAIDRFATVIFHQHQIFTKSRVVAICIGQVILCLVLSNLANSVYPCCRMSLKYAVYTYGYIRTPGPNVSQFVSMPMNCVATLTPLFAYTSV